jgi:hypothetical protein
VTRHPTAERLSAWVSGDMSDRDAVVARVHVGDCADCAEIVAGLRVQASALRTLDRPEPPPTLWLAIEGALDGQRGRGEGQDGASRRFWSWRSSLVGALCGAAAVAAVAWGLTGGGWRGRHERTAVAGAAPPGAADVFAAQAGTDPLLAEAERELDQAATSYAEAAARQRVILDREQALWAPEARARVAERLARLDEAIVHSRAVANRDPGDGVGAEMLFSAYRRQIDFLAEAVHRGSPATGDGFR